MYKRRQKEDMILITFHITRQQLIKLEKLVDEGLFPSRSEAIRCAVREFLDKYYNNATRVTRDVMVMG